MGTQKQPIKKKVRVGKYSICYSVQGKGPSVMLIHGINIGSGQWYKNVEELSKHFTVYAIDLPGAGDSTKIDFRKADLHADFVNTVEQLVANLKIRDLSIVGHSLGGWIAVKVAANSKNQIKKLVVVNPVGFSKNVPSRYKPASIYPFAWLLTNILHKATKDNIRDFLKSVVYKQDKIDNYLADYYYNAIKKGSQHPFMVINRLAGFFTIKKELLLTKEIASLRVPTLCIVGQYDPLTPVVPVKEALESNDDIQLYVFENVGHVPFIEASSKFNKLIVDFLSK